MTILLANLLSIELYEQESWMACIEKKIINLTIRFISEHIIFRVICIYLDNENPIQGGVNGVIKDQKTFNIKVDWINKCHYYFWSENIWVRVGSMMLLLKDLKGH